MSEFNPAHLWLRFFERELTNDGVADPRKAQATFGNAAVDSDVAAVRVDREDQLFLFALDDEGVLRRVQLNEFAGKVECIGFSPRRRWWARPAMREATRE